MDLVGVQKQKSVIVDNLYNSHPGCAFWCGGDFNLPDISWSDETVTGNRYPKQINQNLIDLAHTLDLTQVVDFPTRVNNTLDLLLTNRPTLVHKLIPAPGISDHDSIISAEIDCSARVRRPVRRKNFPMAQTHRPRPHRNSKLHQNCIRHHTRKLHTRHTSRTNLAEH